MDFPLPNTEGTQTTATVPARRSGNKQSTCVTSLTIVLLLYFNRSRKEREGRARVRKGLHKIPTERSKHTSNRDS